VAQNYSVLMFPTVQMSVSSVGKSDISNVSGICYEAIAIGDVHENLNATHGIYTTTRAN